MENVKIYEIIHGIFNSNQVKNSFKKMAEEKLMINCTFAPRKIKFSLNLIVKKSYPYKTENSKKNLKMIRWKISNAMFDV